MAGVATHVFLKQNPHSRATIETLSGAKVAAQAFTIVEGMHGVAGRLAGKFGKAVVLNTPVRAIAQDSSGVTVRPESGEWRAQYAVAKIPMPSSVRIVYDPPLFRGTGRFGTAHAHRLLQ